MNAQSAQLRRNLLLVPLSVAPSRGADPPTCRSNQKLVYGVGIGETARVLCDVDALPNSELAFQWTINDTDFRLEQKYATNSEGLRSSMLFTPFTRADYGLLRCYARNAAGQQDKPCLFTVVPAGQSCCPCFPCCPCCCCEPRRAAISHSARWQRSSIICAARDCA